MEVGGGWRCFPLGSNQTNAGGEQVEGGGSPSSQRSKRPAPCMRSPAPALSSSEAWLCSQLCLPSPPLLCSLLAPCWQPVSTATSASPAPCCPLLQVKYTQPFPIITPPGSYSVTLDAHAGDDQLFCVTVDFQASARHAARS